MIIYIRLMLRNIYEITHVSKSDGRVQNCTCNFARGKSELHRAGCRVTPGGGDSKESATEIYRLALNL